MNDMRQGFWTENLLSMPIILALFQLVLHVAFHGNYGYFRDELYYIACSNHLAWGYVDQPPFSIAVLRISRIMFGDSLYAIRFLPTIAISAVVLLTGMTAKKLGGGKTAQAFAALAVVAAHGLLGNSSFFTMNSFDVLFWSILSYIAVSIFADNRSPLWLPFGIVAGIGMLNKYSVGFLLIGMAAGLTLTRRRKELATRWFWLGAAAAGILFLPHLWWEYSHGFPSLEFMRNASGSKNVNLGAAGYILGQFRDMNFANAPLWLGGIYFFAFRRNGAFRPFAWMYAVVLIIMILGNAKVYYLMAIYPLFLAGGAVLFEDFVAVPNRSRFKPILAGAMIAIMLLALPMAVPILPVDQFINYEHALGLTPRQEEHSAVGELPQYYADQFGWREFVDSVTTAYAKLSPAEQSQCIIYTRNYGEAAVIDFFGKKYGLPGALCAHNSYWFWGPGSRPGNIGIIIGDRTTLEGNFADLCGAYSEVYFITRTNARYCMPYENGRMIFICKGMKTTFQKIWPAERFFI